MPQDVAVCGLAIPSMKLLGIGEVFPSPLLRKGRRFSGIYAYSTFLPKQAKILFQICQIGEAV